MGKPLFTQVATRQNDKQSTSKNPVASPARDNSLSLVQAKKGK